MIGSGIPLPKNLHCTVSDESYDIIDMFGGDGSSGDDNADGQPFPPPGLRRVTAADELLPVLAKPVWQ
jgi:hypothetical protein